MRPVMMWKSLRLVWLCAVATGMLTGCTAPRHEDGYIVDVEADSTRIEGAAAAARSTPDGRPYQYRAVCIEPGIHPTPVYVLSSWVDDPAIAIDLGQYHGDHKAKGHRWHIERRVKHPTHPS